MKSTWEYFARPVTLLFLGTVGVLLFSSALVSPILTLIGLAFVQNLGYSLQSRASTRTSNLYHLIASMLVSLIFFMTLRLLILSEMTLLLLIPYIFGTMLGNMYGTRLSMLIEQKIGAVAKLGKEVKGQAVSMLPTVAGLLVLLGLQFVFLKQFEPIFMCAIAGVAFVQNYIFSVLRAAKNTDSYWFHLVLAMLHGAFSFATYYIMVGVQMDWYLFMPYATGSLIGNMAGAESGKRFGEYLKVSWDAHVLSKDASPWPMLPALVSLLPLILQVFLFADADVSAQVLVFVAALGQNCAMSLISRARQRGHIGYVEWSSVFSNGVWFITLNILVTGKLELFLIIPYLVGTALGSLFGQGVAMRIERKIGAFMNLDAPKRA